MTHEELQKEKELIEALLARHTTEGKASFEDLGRDDDDKSHEVEDYEVNTTLVGELQKRLEDIEAQLAA